MAPALRRYASRQELTAEQLKAHYSELYSHLLEQMQVALREAAAAADPAAGAAAGLAGSGAEGAASCSCVCGSSGACCAGRVSARQAEMLRLAREVEVAGDAARCEELLLGALALQPSACCWHCYALTCVRAGRLARCVQNRERFCRPGCSVYSGQ